MCVCVYVKSHLTSGASVRPEILSRTQRATEVKKFVGFHLKRLGCRDPAHVESHIYVQLGNFPSESAHVYLNGYV